MRRGFYLLPLSCVAGLLVFMTLGLHAQNAANSDTVIRSETRLVLVDAVAVDKKGKFTRDLAQKDFRIWEDGKEQKITSFSLESAGVSPDRPQKHYIVLFFDTATLSPTSQLSLRQDAMHFVDGFASPDRYMAVINSSGGLQILQNFTPDADRLKKALNLVQGSGMSGTASSLQQGAAGRIAPGRGPTSANLSSSADAFAYRNMLAALRGVAKSLAAIRGRKALVLFSGGAAMSGDLTSEVTATIDACNQANVAVYTVDGRGMTGELRAPARRNPAGLLALLPGGLGNAPQAAAMSFQGRGGGTSGGGTTGGGTTGGGTSGGGTTGGGTSGGGTTGGGTTGGTTGGTIGGGTRGGTTGGTTGSNGPAFGTNPSSNPIQNGRNTSPNFPQDDTQIGNQSVLHSLADGTGGLMFATTNDLANALGKIAQEQDEYYLLGYTPTVESAEGTCHNLRLKVDRGGLDVRARKGYCTSKPADLLSGKPVGKDLETRAASGAAGNITAKMQVPYFYSGANVARVSLAMDIIPSGMKFQKDKGKLHGEFDLAGIAYKADGSVAARFSDTVKLDFDAQQQADAFLATPYHYTNQFEIAPGQYNFRMAFSSGEQGFGKVQMPLTIEPWDGRALSVSGLALSHDAHAVADLASGLDESLLEGARPLVSKGTEVVPTGTNLFHAGERGFLYFEVYEPRIAALAALPAAVLPTVAVRVRVLDRASGQQKNDSGPLSAANYMERGKATIPIALALPTTGLAAGAYKVEITISHGTGDDGITRLADFDLN